MLPLTAQETSQFAAIQSLTNREMRLQFSAPAGLNYRIVFKNQVGMDLGVEVRLRNWY